MTQQALIALMPFLAVAGTSVVVMLAIAVRRDHTLCAGLAVAGLLVALALIPAAGSEGAVQVTRLLVIDSYALFFAGLLIAAALLTVLLSSGYLAQEGTSQPEEYYVLLLLATGGAMVLTAANSFASFFLGLELLTVSLYGLIAYVREDVRCLEAGVKYLVLAAASSAFLLFGMALVYAQTGTMEFGPLAKKFVTAAGDLGPLWLTGLAMMVVGIGFKLAVVPFHLWTPDVYEGAPPPVAGFVASVSKGGVVAFLLRFVTMAHLPEVRPVWVLLAAIAVASMYIGNLLALLQRNVKRILAYSSIAHLGYLLVAVLASGAHAPTAATVYLTAYITTILGAFGVVGMLAGGAFSPAVMIDDFRGLFWRRPWPASVLTICLLSLIGMPSTAGYIGKFYVLAAGVESDLWFLVISLVIGSGIGLYYYLQIIIALFASPQQADEEREAEIDESSAEGRPPVRLTTHVGLACLAVLLTFVGVWPTPLLELVAPTPSVWQTREQSAPVPRPLHGLRGRSVPSRWDTTLSTAASFGPRRRTE